MSSNDTGSGGFVIDGKTYVLDTGLDESQGGSQGAADVKVVVNVDNKDITNKTKTTLGDYLSRSTNGELGYAKGTSNRYAVDKGASSVSINDNKGYPSKIDTQPTNSQQSAPSLPTTTSGDFVSVQQDVKKGKRAGSGFDGNDLLQPTGIPTTQKYVSVVLQRNRFTDASTSTTLGDVSDPPSSYDPAVNGQQDMGSFSSHATGVSMGRLAQVGPVLMARAGLELGSTGAGANMNSAAGAASALLPGAAQIGIKRVDKQLLEARDVLSTLTQDEVPSVNYVSYGSQSWGSLNNTEDPWSGLNAIGMAATSTALVAALLVTIDALSAVIGLVTPKTKQPTHDSLGRYALGSYYGGSKKNSTGGLLGAISAVASLDIGSLIGITPTAHPFDVCLKKGSKAFFGIDDSGGILVELTGAATRGFSGPDAGFNAVVARAIIRSSLTIIDQVNKVGGNVVNATRQVLNLVDVLKASKIVSAMNVFAQLGDAMLSVPESYIDKDAVGGLKISEMDSSQNAGANAAGYSRLPGTMKLAWASNMSRSLFLVPSQVTAAALAARDMGAIDPRVTTDIESFDTMQSSVGDGNRLSSDQVAQTEKMLEAEYMPFYFHDLRTNEIIGFHAFLTNLSDSFQVTRESNVYMGRIEPVRGYTSTERKISLSFMIVSTSISDFDAMWIKINKLVTLVYPQFTQGKQVQDNEGQYKFTLPFSQLVGASPVVRIRLGDLFRSNYSKFGLARLFGLGNENFTLDGKTFTDVSAITDADQEFVGNQFLLFYADPQGETYVPEGQAYAYNEDGSIHLSLPNPFGGSTGTGGNAPVFKQKGGGGDYFMIKAIKSVGDSLIVGEVAINEDYDCWDGVRGGRDAVETAYSNPDDINNNVIGGRYMFSVSQLSPTRATKKKAIDNVLADKVTTDEFTPALNDFMDDEKNALVKSFKEVGGKGLACVIDTIDFDYNQSTWELQQDRRAPKMLKVSVNISPIHDIAPGLDSRGYNRSPVFPVGRMAPSPGIKPPTL